jgi:hypothetical protein
MRHCQTLAVHIGAIASVLLLTTGCSSPAGDGVVALQQPSAFPIVINQPGSYRLAGNIIVPDANTTAIRVESRDVTIDLHGFAILGPTVCSGIPVSCNQTGNGSGITAIGNAGKRENVAVHSGTIKGMGSDGLNLSEHATIWDVRAISNGNNGIAGNMSSKITGSVALANGNRGIVTASRSIVTGNIANENGIGINMNSEGVVSGNTASFNKFDGITCADDCTLTGNTVVGNGFGGSLPIGRGIVTNSRSTLIGNAVNGNKGVGLFLVSGDGYVHNVLSGNNGGGANPQVSGGVQIGQNLCGAAVCP